MLTKSGLLCLSWHLWTGWAKINAQHFHASDDSQSRLQDVAVDDCSKLHLFFFCVTTLMQNPGKRKIEENALLIICQEKTLGILYIPNAYAYIDMNLNYVSIRSERE